MKLFRLLFGVILVASIALKSLAQDATDLLPETQGAKALLEDLISRRYKQELSTQIDVNYFSLGTRLELTRVEKTVSTEKPKVDEIKSDVPVITDLMLGTIDPESLIEKYTAPDQAEVTKQLLDNFRIKKVTISVGLRDNLPKEAKANVEKWLNERVTQEFGKIGTGTVTLTVSIPIATPLASNLASPETKPIEKQPIDWLNQFQNLAGQLVMALALLIGIVLWRLMGGGKSSSASNNQGSSTSANTAGGTTAAAGGGVAGGVGGYGGGFASGSGAGLGGEMVMSSKTSQENQTAIEMIGETTDKILKLLPHSAPNFESIVRSWCQMGDPGRFRLAVFADAVGREVGKLPIPVDALSEVSRVFSRMIEMPPAERLTHLQKAYWDILGVLNLGPDVLNQPFAYLGGVNTNVVSQILVEENPKLKALVSLYMPLDMRSRYFKNLNANDKLELLKQAGQMDSVPTDELESMDRAVKGKIQPSSNRKTVSLERSFDKIVEALKPQEEIALLGQIQGPIAEAYKRSTPSLAYLEFWPNDKLKIFLNRVTADEIIPFLRLRPSAKDRFLSLMPQMTSEMVTEELAIADRSNADEKDKWLMALKTRLLQMFELKELNLDDIFPVGVESLNANNKAS